MCCKIINLDKCCTIAHIRGLEDVILFLKLPRNQEQTGSVCLRSGDICGIHFKQYCCSKLNRLFCSQIYNTPFYIYRTYRDADDNK